MNGQPGFSPAGTPIGGIGLTPYPAYGAEHSNIQERSSRGPQLQLNALPMNFKRDNDQYSYQYGAETMDNSLYSAGFDAPQGNNQSRPNRHWSPQLNLRPSFLSSNDRGNLRDEGFTNLYSGEYLMPQERPATFENNPPQFFNNPRNISRPQMPQENPYRLPTPQGPTPYYGTPPSARDSFVSHGHQSSQGMIGRPSYGQSGLSNIQARPEQQIIAELKRQLNYVTAAVDSLRKQHGIDRDIEVSRNYLRRADDRMLDNKRESEYLTELYSRLNQENREVTQKMLKLNKVDFDASITDLEGHEKLIAENERLRSKLKQLEMDIKRKLKAKEDSIEEKVKSQLENEANFLAFRYQSDDEALKLDVKAYHQLLLERNAFLRSQR